MDTAYPVGQTGEAFLFVLIFLIEKAFLCIPGYPVFIGLGDYHPVMGTFLFEILT